MIISEDNFCALMQRVKANDKNLKHLDVSKYVLNPKQIPILMDALLHNQAVEILDLTGNCHFNDEASIQLSHNRSIKQLNVSKCNLNASGIEPWLQNASVLYLNLSENPIKDQDITSMLPSLSNNHSLKTLVLGPLGEGDISSDNIKELADCVHVNVLHLKKILINSEAAIVLAMNPHLNELQIHHGSIGNEQAMLLLQSASIWRLNLDHNLLDGHEGEFLNESFQELMHAINTNKILVDFSCKNTPFDRSLYQPSNISMAGDCMMAIRIQLMENLCKHMNQPLTSYFEEKIKPLYDMAQPIPVPKFRF